MEKSTTPCPNKNHCDSVWVTAAYILGLAMGMLIATVWIWEHTAHAQQALLWPTPEVHGTVRDLTHLPALPHFPMDPTNLQHQAWSQPGSAMASEPHNGVVFLEAPWVTITPSTMEPTAYPPLARQILVDIIKRYERQSR